MFGISREEVQRIKETYPEGTRIILKRMNDPFNPTPSGTMGTVTNVDDIGQIHWTGGIAIHEDEDEFYRIDKMGWPIDKNGNRVDIW